MGRKVGAMPDGRFAGRINATRFDFFVDMGTPGANEFDVVMQGFFRNTEDAVAYAEAYLAANGWEPEGGDVETDPTPDTDTSESAPAGSETETAPAGGETESAPAGSETETAPAGSETETAPAGDNTASGGCFGTVGFGAIAIVAVAAVAGFVTLKKKD